MGCNIIFGDTNIISDQCNTIIGGGKNDIGGNFFYSCNKCNKPYFISNNDKGICKKCNRQEKLNNLLNEK